MCCVVYFKERHQADLQQSQSRLMDVLEARLRATEESNAQVRLRSRHSFFAPYESLLALLECGLC